MQLEHFLSDRSPEASSYRRCRRRLRRHCRQEVVDLVHYLPATQGSLPSAGAPAANRRLAYPCKLSASSTVSFLSPLLLAFPAIPGEAWPEGFGRREAEPRAASTSHVSSAERVPRRRALPERRWARINQELCGGVGGWLPQVHVPDLIGLLLSMCAHQVRHFDPAATPPRVCPSYPSCLWRVGCCRAPRTVRRPGWSGATRPYDGLGGAAGAIH